MLQFQFRYSPIWWFGRIVSVGATLFSQWIGRVIIGHRWVAVQGLVNRRLSDSGSWDRNYRNLFKLKRTLCLLRCCLHQMRHVWWRLLCTGRKHYFSKHINTVSRDEAHDKIEFLPCAFFFSGRTMLSVCSFRVYAPKLTLNCQKEEKNHNWFYYFVTLCARLFYDYYLFYFIYIYYKITLTSTITIITRKTIFILYSSSLFFSISLIFFFTIELISQWTIWIDVEPYVRKLYTYMYVYMLLEL